MIVTTNDKHYGDIADAIRDKLGTTDGYKPEDMAAAVGDIESGGGNYQSKSVTYTSNGIDKVTPDAGYDALSEVNVTVDVSGGGGVETCTLTINAEQEPGGDNTSCVHANTPDGVQTYYDVRNVYHIKKLGSWSLFVNLVLAAVIKELNGFGLIKLYKTNRESYYLANKRLIKEV